MPYDNEYNRKIADMVRNSQERYIALNPVVMSGNFKYASANKDHDRTVPDQFFRGGSGFADGTFRDRGDERVQGAVGGSMEYIEALGKILKPIGKMVGLGELGLTNEDLNRGRQGAGASGGFKMSDLGNKDFWNNLTLSGGFKMSDLGNKDFWNNLTLSGGFKMSDLGNKDFWNSITISGAGLHTPHMSGGFRLGDLMDSNFWKDLQIRGSGMSGGNFWSDFKKGFNMVFEPGSEYILKPLAAATGNVPVLAGLTALGYGKKKGGFKMSDLADVDFWKNISINKGSGKHLKMKMEGGFRVGDLLSKDFWDTVKVGGNAFTDFFKSLGDKDTYKKLGNQIADPFVQAYDAVKPIGNMDTYKPLYQANNKFFNSVNEEVAKGVSKLGLGMKTQEILADHKAEKRPDMEQAARKIGGKKSKKSKEGTSGSKSPKKKSKLDEKIMKLVQQKIGGAIPVNYEGTAKQKPLIQLQGKLPPKSNLPSSSLGSGKKGLPQALKKWQEHLKQYRKDHPECSMKEAMQKAKLTYKK